MKTSTSCEAAPTADRRLTYIKVKLPEWDHRDGTRNSSKAFIFFAKSAGILMERNRNRKETIMLELFMFLGWMSVALALAIVPGEMEYRLLKEDEHIDYVD